MHRPISKQQPYCIEAVQYKSSEEITNGIAPSSENALKKGSIEDKPEAETIWKEYKKIMNDDHQKFYQKLGSYELDFFLISNKVYEDDFPECLAGLVCNKNFEEYCGPFAHPGLFKKAKTEQGEDRMDAMDYEKMVRKNLNLLETNALSLNKQGNGMKNEIRCINQQDLKNYEG